MGKTKRAISILLAAIGALTLLCISFIFIQSKPMTAYADVTSQDSSIGNQPDDGGEVILNYESVFAAYYTDAKERYESTGKTFVDFETFCENYYTSGQDIAAYTESYFGRTNSISTYSSSGSSASSDEDYILSKYKYDKTPASTFKRAPKYTEYLYANIRNGDLVCETDAIFDAGHTAVITDINHDSDYGRYYQTIEAVAGGVQYGFLDDDRVVKMSVIIYRARGYSQSMHSNLLYFLEHQLGKTYSLVITRQNKSIDSKQWFCSELAWAAFNYVGLDIGQVGGVPLGGSGNSGGCLPVTIELSDNTYRVDIQGTQYLRMSIVGKFGTTWSIKITNANGFDIDATYNQRMCFEFHLKSEDPIGKLNHRTPVTISRYSSVTVNIKEYLFATSVVCYWQKDGKTYMTYGKELHKNTKTMDVKYINF